MQHNTTQHNTTQSNTTQYNTTATYNRRSQLTDCDISTNRLTSLLHCRLVINVTAVRAMVRMV